MTNVLKSQSKSSTGQLIENQLPRLDLLPIGQGPARRQAALVRFAKGCPPFAAQPLPGRLHPPGGGPRVVSLPLCVTPCSLFGASLAPAGHGNFGTADRGQGVRP